MENEPLEGLVHQNLYCDRIFSCPPELVWRGLTEASVLSRWLMKTDFEPVVDRPFQMETQGVVIDGKVFEVRVYEKLAYTWALADMSCRVFWELRLTEQGTHVFVQQAGTFSHQLAYQAHARNPWPTFMSRLDYQLFRLT